MNDPAVTLSNSGKIRSNTDILVLSALYLGLGISLYFTVPTFDAVYAELIRNWSTSPSLLVKAFQIPPYYWLLAFGAMAVTLWYFGSRARGVARIRIAGGSLILWAVIVFHALDWLYGFIFCHGWVCNRRLLPTWYLLSWLS
ncbi:MAG: hypothetical protein HY255_10930 [Betaproteobacteria bacterium]|nr:hypothetical protein [Betaproteobacteria bacterium]